MLRRLESFFFSNGNDYRGTTAAERGRERGAVLEGHWKGREKKNDGMENEVDTFSRGRRERSF